MSSGQAHYSTGPEFRDTSKRFVTLLGVFIVLVGLAYFFSRPAYKRIKAYRALGVARQGEVLLSQSRLAEAGRLAKVATEMAPDNPEVLRFAAHYCSKSGLSDGLKYWQAFIDGPAATTDDQIEYARFLLDINRLDAVAPLLSAKLAAHPDDPVWLQLETRRCRQAGQLSRAVAVATSWVNSRPNDDEALVEFGQLLVNTADPSDHDRGRRALWAVAVGHGAWRDRALDALVAMQDLSREDCIVLLKTIGDAPDRRFGAYTLRAKAYPDQKAAILQEVAALGTGAGTNILVRSEAARWLAANGQTERVLDVIPLEVATKNGALLTARLEALIEIGRQAEARPYLDREDTPMEPYLANCLRAAAAKASDRPQMVTGFFEAAINASGGSPGKLLFVAEYAQRMGESRAAIDAYRRLMAWPPATYTAGQAILRLTADRRDSRIESETLKKLADFMPGNIQFFVLSSYYGLLLGDKLGAPQRTRLEQLAHDRTNEVVFSVVLALGELRDADAGRALARLEALKLDWSKTDQRYQAVFAAALGGAQQREAARTVARRIDLEKLRPEERQLIQEWL